MATQYSDRATQYSDMATHYSDRATQYSDMATQYSDMATQYSDRATQYSDRVIATLTWMSAGLQSGAQTHSLSRRLPPGVLHRSSLSISDPSAVPVAWFTRISRFVRVTESKTYKRISD